MRFQIIGKTVFSQYILVLRKQKGLILCRYVGFSQANSPMLVIRDPELIKQICIKDFDNFNEHRSFGTDVGIDPLWDKNLFAAKGTW